MKKKLTYILTATLIIVCFAGSVYAQSDNHDVNIVVPTIRLLGVYDNTGASFSGQTLTITVADPANPGDSFIDPSDNSLYLRYSVLTASATPQKITSQITGGDAVPAAIDLNVTASIGGDGAGEQGTGSTQTLDGGAAMDLITSIESCWTGTNNTSGANLEYVVDLPADPATLETSNTTHTITYTVVDE
ncbi:MAG: hypothetical protein R6V04_14955 [bacterium]